jgi:hypothetical protein
MPIFHSNSTFTLCSAAAMFVLFWGDLWPLLEDCLKLIVDFRPHCFSTNQVFALLFEINCTEINQSSNICMYIISTVNIPLLNYISEV